MSNPITRHNAETSAVPAKRRKTAIRLFAAGFALIFVLSVILLVVFCFNSGEASRSMPIPVSFFGEYSQDGGAWQTLTESTKLNALEGDLVLRGRFDMQSDTAMLHVYLDCISFSVLIDGETEIAWSAKEYPGTDATGSHWLGWNSEALSGKSVEIRLTNDISIGNPNAYNDFLDKLYVGPVFAFESYILYPGDYLSRNIEYEGAELWAWFLQSGQFWRGVGFGIFMVALVLFGIAVADSLSSRLFGKKLWLIG